MCILALFSRLSVVCLVLSGPKGTSFFSCSRYSRSLARLQRHTSTEARGPSDDIQQSNSQHTQNVGDNCQTKIHKQFASNITTFTKWHRIPQPARAVPKTQHLNIYISPHQQELCILFLFFHLLFPHTSLLKLETEKENVYRALFSSSARVAKRWFAVCEKHKVGDLDPAEGSVANPQWVHACACEHARPGVYGYEKRHIAPHRFILGQPL